MSKRWGEPQFAQVAIIAKPGMSFSRLGTGVFMGLLDYRGGLRSTGDMHWVVFDPQTQAAAFEFARKIRNLRDAEHLHSYIRRVLTIPFKYEDPDHTTDFQEKEYDKLEREYVLASARAQ